MIRSELSVVVLALVVSALAGTSMACGATSGPNSGEIMFEFGAEEEPDSGVDGGRRPLPLGDAAAPR